MDGFLLARSIDINFGLSFLKGMEIVNLRELNKLIRETNEYLEKIYFVRSMTTISFSLFVAMFPDEQKCFQQLVKKIQIIIDENIEKIDIQNIYREINNNNVYMLSCSLFSDDSETCFNNKLHHTGNINNSVDWDSEKFAKIILAQLFDIDQKQGVDLSKVIVNERFEYKTTDYKLTKLDDWEFYADGIIFDNKAYLFNGLLIRDKISEMDNIPGFARIILKNKSNGNFFFRIDEQLAMPKDKKIEYTGTKFAQYFGPKFSFDHINKFLNGKSITIHYNESTMNKLLLVVKPDYDEKLKQDFLHIELETLPTPDSFNNRNVITTFLHGKYYIDSRTFNHIDLANNQYLIEEYERKYNGIGINVDYHSLKNLHYKQWCIEDGVYDEKTWYELVICSIKKEYRDLLDEILGSADC